MIELPAGNGNRGGARNRASRENFCLSAAQIANLAAAFEHAARIGLPLTRFITIHWKAAGVSLEGMVKATGRFLDLAGKAIARRGKCTSWVYVHENGVLEGWHCHILLHVPRELVSYVQRRQIRWIKRITGQAYRLRVLKTRSVGGFLGVDQVNPDLHHHNVARALEYMLKQADEEAAVDFQLPRRGGLSLVVGKRAGTSQNIGSSARRRYGAVK